MAEPTAHVKEIFSGLQGEGLYVGERQLFVRFEGCNLRCLYCDTPAALTRTLMARVEEEPGSRKFTELPNPFGVEELLAEIRRMCQRHGLHKHIALTGGEPFCSQAFLYALLPELHQRGYKVYLDTNATYGSAAGELAPFVDVYAADLKLFSTSGMPDTLPLHRWFLERVPHDKVFVKLVCTASMDEGEFADAIALIASLNPALPLVLQPVSAAEPEVIPTEAQLLRWQGQASEFLSTVRVVPQVHVPAGWK